jgi:hypothetical protein
MHLNTYAMHCIAMGQNLCVVALVSIRMRHQKDIGLITL